MRKVLIGVAIGITLTALVSLLYSTYMLKGYALNAPKLLPVNDSTANYSTLQQGLNGLKLEHSNFVERIAATNKRIDDILVFGGIIGSVSV